VDRPGFGGLKFGKVQRVTLKDAGGALRVIR
jgi:hypothetical protein